MIFIWYRTYPKTNPLVKYCRSLIYLVLYHTHYHEIQRNLRQTMGYNRDTCQNQLKQEDQEVMTG
jgi:hypothetical protein